MFQIASIHRKSFIFRFYFFKWWRITNLIAAAGMKLRYEDNNRNVSGSVQNISIGDFLSLMELADTKFRQKKLKSAVEHWRVIAMKRIFERERKMVWACLLFAYFS
jgi:hypothetical protein